MTTESTGAEVDPPISCPAFRVPVDIADPRTYLGEDAHAFWTELRRTDPVSRQVDPSGTTYWAVTRWQDVDTVLRDHETYTSERGTLLFLIGQGDPAGGKQMAATDPPRHTQLREPLQRTLTIKEVERRREQLRDVIVELIEPLADGGEYDLAEYMIRMPLAVIGTIMGLPREDWPMLTRLTMQAIAPDDDVFGNGDATRDILARSHRGIFAYFTDLIAERGDYAGDDVISLLQRMEIDGRTLTAGEVISNCYSLLLGASVTMAQVPVTTVDHMSGSAMWERWANDEDPTAIRTGTEEAFRWSSPTNHFMRYATRDTVLSGVEISAGEPVVVWLGSANRDERVFDKPFVFDPYRRPNRHLAFGIGPHYCVGHTVARVANRLVFAELFRRFSAVHTTSDPGRRLVSNVIAGWTRRPVEATLRRTLREAAY